MRSKGSLASPTIKTTAKINELVFNNNNYGKALFTYDNLENEIHIKFNITKSLTLDLSLPKGNFDEFSVKAETNNFNLSPLIAYLTVKEPTNDKMEITSKVSGTINTTNPWNSKVLADIKKISMHYNGNKMSSKNSVTIALEDHQLSMNELHLEGNKQFFKISQSFSEEFISRFIIHGRMNIVFFKILTPFLEKIDGFGSFRLELALEKHDFKLIGSSNINDGFIKFPGFPHPFEDLSADILLNQKQIAINSLSGQIAEGKVRGNGEVYFKGGKKFDLKIKTEMEDIHLHFPDGFKTQGNANIQLSGSGIPFLLKGQYTITEGLIESNFDSKKKPKSINLLDKILKEETTSPLSIRLDVKTKNSIEIRNNLVEGYLNTNLIIYDKIKSPRIKGEAHLEKKTSTVRFGNNEFKVTDSAFLFEGKSPINPKLSLRAQSRVNSYDIEIFLKGRANKPVLKASSQPPLLENQIITMLALGTLPGQFEQNNSIVNTNEGGQFEIGTSLLGDNPLGEEFKKHLDMDIQFSSSFDDQNNTAMPKVTFRKKLTKELQISVSQTTGQAQQSEGRVTYEFNPQLSTIFRITNFSEQTNASDNTNLNRQNNPVGVDLEYKVEFD